MITTEAKGYTTSARFPTLRVHKTSTSDNPRNGVIVLFTSDTVGTVVHTPAGVPPLGYHNSHWGAEYFEDFCGELTLKQE